MLEAKVAFLSGHPAPKPDLRRIEIIQKIYSSRENEGHSYEKVPGSVGQASFTILRCKSWLLQKDIPTNLVEMLAVPSFLSF